MLILLGVLVFLIVLLTICLFVQRRHGVFDYYYFDANATTRPHDCAISAYNESLYLGNYSASYANTNILDESNAVILNRLHCDGNYKVIFNSGASEGNNHVLRSLAVPTPSGTVPHFILSAVEHKTSLLCARDLEARGCITLTVVLPNSEGIVSPVEIAKNVRPDTQLISVMYANNEIGSINDIYSIGKVARECGALFHCDIVQGFGKNTINIPKCCIDAATISFHKLHGLIGTGALVVSPRFIKTAKSQISGTQFYGMRGGTVNLPGIAAACAAMKETFRNREKKNAKLLRYKQLLIGELAGENMVVLGPNPADYDYTNKSLCNTILIAFPGICNLNMRKTLQDKGFIISIGAACNTSGGPSHVLLAINAPRKIRSGTVRISFNDYNTESEVLRLAHAIKRYLAEKQKK